jgi:hypothetical protein
MPQRVALYELVISSLKAADTLASDCPAKGATRKRDLVVGATAWLRLGPGSRPQRYRGAARTEVRQLRHQAHQRIPVLSFRFPVRLKNRKSSSVHCWKSHIVPVEILSLVSAGSNSGQPAGESMGHAISRCGASHLIRSSRAADVRAPRTPSNEQWKRRHNRIER